MINQTKKFPFKEFQESFSNLKQFYKISLESDFRDGFNLFKKDLIGATSKLPHIGTPLPKVWVEIRIELEKLKSSGTNYISESRYLEICRKHYRDVDGAMFLSEFFHDLGVILHFKNDLELKNTVFLNHEWITKGVYKVLDDKKVIEQKGRFSLGDINRIWSEEQYREKMSQLLSLMKNKKFDLCFELENGDFMVPRLLPIDDIDIGWRETSDLIRFEIRYNFMPKGILARLIVKMNQDIYDDKCWRYGALVKYENTEALIRERYFDKKVTIALRGENKKEFLAIIRKQIHQINKDFRRLQTEEMVQCICELCTNSDNPYFHSYNLLRRCEQQGRARILCQNSMTDVSVADLLSDILGARVSKEKLIYCENRNAELLNALDLENVSFVAEQDSAGVFSQTKSRVGKYGLRDRDFLLDTEIDRLRMKYPNYYILEYYCFENYLYHPANISELGISNLNIEEYKKQLVEQKNATKDLIVSNYKSARRSYFELKVSSEKILDKEREGDVIKYLNSDDIEIFFKAFSVKDHFNKEFISKYGITQKELASTQWFKTKILELIDPKL